MMRLLPADFSVHSTEDERWLLVAPADEPTPGMTFDRKELCERSDGR
jgi:hypothetical protein